jgi:CheY-like chemotaxis protein
MPSAKTQPTVVLIEPNGNDQEVFSALLTGDGYTVEAVSAMEYIQTPRENIDLVICDANLTAGDSYELCQHFQSQKKLRDIPFLYLSEHSDAGTIEDAFSAGAAAFCAKPIASQPFICQVRALLKMRQVFKDNLVQRRKARDAALSSMKEAERLRALVQLLHHAFECTTYADLAQALFDYSLAHEFSLGFMILHQGKFFFYSDDGQQRPLEEKLMQAQWQGIYKDKVMETRIISHEGRIIASFENCSILVRKTDTPTDDLLDYLGVLMNSLDKVVLRIATLYDNPLSPAQIPVKSADSSNESFDDDDEITLF